jgi:hypothetical protein
MKADIKDSQIEYYECLERNEEIEFDFNGKHYSIQPENNGYGIWVEGEGKVEFFKTLSEVLNNKYLDGMSFLEAEAKQLLKNTILF